MKKIFIIILSSFICLSVFAAANKTDYSKPIKDVNYSSVNLLPLDGLWAWADSPEKFTYKAIKNSGKTAAYYKSAGNINYSLTLVEEIPVKEGETYLLSVRTKIKDGTFSASFIEKNMNNEVIDWNYSQIFREADNEIQNIYCLITIDSNVKTIQPRFSHHKNAVEAEVYEISLQKITLPKTVKETVIENNTLKVSVDLNSLACTITDKRNSKTYFQDKSFVLNQYLTAGKRGKKFIEINGFDINSACTYIYKIEFSAEDSATVDYSLSMMDSSGKINTENCIFTADISFPKKALSQKGDYLVLPMDEGMCIDYDDPILKDTPGWKWICDAGSGRMSMPFFGITNRKDGAGFISIVKTQNDSYIKPESLETNAVGIMWRSQKNKIGYERKLSQTFLTEGNHVAIAKKYREYAKQNGTLVTFEEKRQLRGEEYSKNLDRFLGSANVWSWDSEWPGHDRLAMIKDMKNSGIDKILWSHKQSKRVVDELNKMDVLPGHYTIIRDILSPEEVVYTNFPENILPDGDSPAMYFPQAYPSEVIIEKDGSIRKHWPIQKNDGSGLMYCSVICPSKVEKYQMDLIDKEKNHGYGAYFLDCVAFNPFYECYSPTHPLTRSEFRYWQYKQLENAAKTGQVVGSETGCDYVVPVCDYFEGMLSLCEFRCDNSGADVSNSYDKAQPQITNYQLNPKYRLPLFELVYHDCCVSMWYWDDNNNKFTDVIKTRDSFNALYGCPPLYWVYDEPYWEKHKKMLVDSYKRSSDIVKKVAGLEMTNHEFLTEDRSVQRTSFSDGTKITVDLSKNSISIE